MRSRSSSPARRSPTTARPATSCASGRADCSGGSRRASSTSASAPAWRSRTPRAPGPTSSPAAPPGSFCSRHRLHGTVVLWAIFAVELAGLVTLGVQRSVVERRGGGEPWLIRGAEPALERALEAGERRQVANERLPPGEFENRQRLQNLALAASAGMSLPGAIAIVQTDAIPSEWCIPALFLTGMAGADVAVVLAVIVGMWRGWLPLPDDGDDGDDDDDDLQPAPGGAYTRAHLFNLRR